MDGHPATAGYVVFRRIDKDQPAFAIHCNIENGRYSSEFGNRSLPPGNYEVRVAVTRNTGRTIPLPGAPNGQMQDEIVVISAAQYHGPKSPLRYAHIGQQGIATLDLDVPDGR